jgi:hypothetical protein
MGIVDHAKELADLIKKYNDQELYERIVTLREEILALREENIGLKEDLRKLREASDISSQLIRQGNCYFRKDDVKQEHPFCLTCWDADRKLVSLILSTDQWGTHIKCGICAARKK